MGDDDMILRNQCWLWDWKSQLLHAQTSTFYTEVNQFYSNGSEKENFHHDCAPYWSVWPFLHAVFSKALLKKKCIQTVCLYFCLVLFFLSQRWQTSLCPLRTEKAQELLIQPYCIVVHFMCWWCWFQATEAHKRGDRLSQFCGSPFH